MMTNAQLMVLARAAYRLYVQEAALDVELAPLDPDYMEELRLTLIDLGQLPED